MPGLLIIDDEPLTLDCFRHLFPKGQVNVSTARTATEGVKQFSEQRPDVVVLDIRFRTSRAWRPFAVFTTWIPRSPSF